MVIPNWVRTLNKVFTNRLMMLIAGRRFSPIAVVEHLGRRSGKRYRTPIMVAPEADGFVFALTYGPGVDWYHNVLAAGECRLRWQGKEYPLCDPVPIEPATALPAFSPFPRLVLRASRLEHFFKMKAQEAVP